MSSPFAPKLGTNYCPKDEEIAEIKALLIEPVLRLKRLDDEITEMQKALDKLAAERDALAAYVDGHKALISPIRQLPLDVIHEIFMACIPTHRNCVMSASEAPVLLGRICSAWRNISLSTPHLWARLHIVEPRHPSSPTSPLFEQKLAQRLETTKTWLGRSGQCPLSISLAASTGQSSHTEIFLRALIPFAPRWQHISFTAPPAALDTLLPLTEADVPLLKSLAFSLLPCPDPDETVQWELLGMLGSSELSDFSISTGNLSPTELPLRWNLLTSLSITGRGSWDGGFPSDIILQTISRCPALRSCAMMVSGSEIQTPHSIVELPFLHTLDLSCPISMRFPFTFFLPWISLPGLRTFVLRGSPYYTPEGKIQEIDSASEESLRYFFSVSTCLESLDTDNMFGKSSLIQVIRALPPTIQRLAIQECGPCSLDDDVLEVLTPGPGLPPHACPALQELNIHGSFLASDRAVLQFVTARMAVGSGSTLKRVEIRFRREMELDILPSLQPFIETAKLEASFEHLKPLSLQYSGPWQGLADAPGSYSSPFDYPWVN